MAVPKKRTSKSRRDKRRSHERLSAPTVVPCPQCNEPRLPHRICPHCGYYKKAGIIEVE
jgi:large subunit ribosomal protein L32